jgi:hypothetical protein
MDMEENAVRRFAATFVTDTTNPPAPRPRWLRRGRYDLVEVADVIIALIGFAVTNSALNNANATDHGHHSTGVLVLTALSPAPAVAAHAVPAQRVGGFHGGHHLYEPGDPAGLARWAGRPGAGRTRLRPVPVRGGAPLPPADRGRRGGRHRGRGGVRRSRGSAPGCLPGRGPHPPRRRGPGPAQRRGPARGAGAAALRRASVARGAAAHRPGAARRGRPQHVGDRDPGRAAPYKTADPPPGWWRASGDQGERAGGPDRAAPCAGRAAHRRPGRTRPAGLADLDALLDSARSGGVCRSPCPRGTP